MGQHKIGENYPGELPFSEVNEKTNKKQTSSKNKTKQQQQQKYCPFILFWLLMLECLKAANFARDLFHKRIALVCLFVCLFDLNLLCAFIVLYNNTFF